MKEMKKKRKKHKGCRNNGFVHYFYTLYAFFFFSSFLSFFNFPFFKLLKYQTWLLRLQSPLQDFYMFWGFFCTISHEKQKIMKYFLGFNWEKWIQVGFHPIEVWNPVAKTSILVVPWDWNIKKKKRVCIGPLHQKHSSFFPYFGWNVFCFSAELENWFLFLSVQNCH